MKPLSPKEAQNVLSAWTALEVLSPTGFRKPEDLNDNNVKSVILLDQGNLPWENGGEIAPKGKEIFYHVVIGTLDLDKCTEALIEKYGDLDIESPKITGGAVIASITVDQFGCLITDKPAVSLSSFAWGVPQALTGSLKNLSQWPDQEQEILKEFKEILFAEIYAQGSASLTNDIINRAYTYLIETLKIPRDLLHYHRYQKFAIRLYQSIPMNKKNAQSPWPLLVNSFFLKDLALAKDLISKGEAPENLLKYLGVKLPAQRYQMLKDDGVKDYEVLENILAPQKMPYARWPSQGRHPLVLKQQAAVNVSMSFLEEGEILGINGPPGTGKTTLLRDIVAGIITKRAEALLKFHNPMDAFVDTKYKVPAGSGVFSVYQLDNALKGFEILIASSNNKAAENISAELPGLNAIAEDADDLRYFKTLSDYLLGDESWGLISAVLGNSLNRYQFCKKFWWDADVSMFSYLDEVAKLTSEKENSNGKRDKISKTINAQIIQDCDPPRNRKEALGQWKKARKRFIEALRQVPEKFDDLQDKRDSIFQLQSFNKTLKEGQILKDLISEHQFCRPHFLTRFFRLPAGRRWTKEYKRLSLWQNLKEKTEPYFKNSDPHLVDVNLFLKSSKEYNQISPWCDKDLQILRDKVFIEAIKLHKAFIDAVAKPLKHNLGLSTPKEGIDKELLNYMSDIWSSFFLVVPSVSTTFASANTMLNCLPLQSLGWLLIDEAGQAVPQAAVGTLMKTRRAIVTGDPLQIEPVITLPSKLTESIFEQFEANALKFNPPKASVQSLADEASCYFAEINNRSIGFPLLVHRRCTSPMFEISNNIAYDNSMVQAKKSQASLIRNCLGPSAWFDVQSEDEIQDKWCPEEGEKVIDLLKQLKNADVLPDLYIITPFKIVANHLRTKIKESKILESWDDINPESWVYNNIGTVHTFQGREAEAVILVLGAPLESQLGSKKWAGSTPNLLNVAVTRAKEVFYVVGNIDLWKDIGVFKELENRLNFVITKHESKKFVVGQ